MNFTPRPGLPPGELQSGTAAAAIHSLYRASAYRADIDGLRAIAILAVLVFHAFPTLLPGGFAGVDLFFVISGYLITGILVSSPANTASELRRFYIRRTVRIFPALILVLFACLVAGRIALLPDEFEQLAKHVAGGAFFVQNFVLWGEQGYFDTPSNLKPLLHLWSLAIEEQFYLAYPLGLWVAARLGVRLHIAVGSAAAASFGLNLYGVESDAAGTFFLPHTRVWELLVGGLLALFVSRSDRSGDALSRFALALRPAMRRWPDMQSAAGLLLIASSFVLLNKQQSFPGTAAVLPVGGAILLILAGPGAWINRRLLSLRPLVYIGLISYPLYLWHWPLLAFARVLSFNDPGVGIRLLALLLGLLLAWASYRWVERPLQRTRSGSRAVMLCIGLTLLGGAALAWKDLQARSSVSARHPGSDFLLQLRWTERDNWTQECRSRTGLSDIAYCLQATDRTADAVLIGDSHANALYWGLSDEYRRMGKSLLGLGAPGCPPLLELDYSIPGEPPMPCRRWIRESIRLALASPSVKQLILSTYALRNMQGDALGLPQAQPKTVQFGLQPELSGAAAFGAAFRHTLRHLLDSGKQVIVVIDWPELSFDPRACFDGRPVMFGVQSRQDCRVDRQQLVVRNRAYMELIAELRQEFPAVQWLDPWPHLCDANSCTAMPDRRLGYRDTHHLSKAGSAYLARAFRDSLLVP